MTSTPPEPPDTTALSKRASAPRLFVPESELPEALRRRFGGGTAMLPRGVALIADHSEGLSLGQTAVRASLVGALGMLSWGGTSALIHSVSLSPWTFTRVLFWGAWLVCLLAVLGLTFGALGLTAAAFLRSVWVQRQLDEGQWPYGLFILPQALVFRTPESCHVLPRASVRRAVPLRGGADYRLCPGVEIVTPEGEPQELCFDGVFSDSARAINQSLSDWLDDTRAPTLELDAVTDRRPDLTGDLQPPDSGLGAIVKSPLRSTPALRQTSRWDDLWHRTTGRRRAIESEGKILLSSNMLSHVRSDGERVEVALDKPFTVLLTAQLISDETAELNVSLRPRGAPPTSPSLCFRVRLPQSAVGRAIPLKEEGFAYLAPETFAQIWPAIVFGVAAAGLGPLPIDLQPR